MIVNVEFFDENPIENVITSLNYQTDKTIFFGYENMLKEKQQCVETFMKEICGVQEVEFCVVDEMDLSSVIDKITDTVEKEIENGHRVFFDLTGGESLPLVAFGIISKELAAPMHKYDVFKNQMYEYGYEGSLLLSESAVYDPIELNLDGFISLYGGVINDELRKAYQDEWHDKDFKEVKEVWTLYQEHHKEWVYYTEILQQLKPDEDLYVNVGKSVIVFEISEHKEISEESFRRFLHSCEKAGFMKKVRCKDGYYSFTYRSKSIQNYLCAAGRILEMYVFMNEYNAGNSNDCAVSVHIDWDGVVHATPSEDVHNEIDVLTIENNLPTFISCKIGNADQRALYELETVASRFGGKYAKKVLMIAKEMSPSHLLRAEELGIEVRRVNFT